MPQAWRKEVSLLLVVVWVAYKLSLRQDISRTVKTGHQQNEPQVRNPNDCVAQSKIPTKHAPPPVILLGACIIKTSPSMGILQPKPRSCEWLGTKRVSRAALKEAVIKEAYKGKKPSHQGRSDLDRDRDKKKMQLLKL